MKTDVVIVGAGPGGAASALFLERLGIRSTIIEKVPFPRYHIGESLTGECGNCLRSLGLGDEMLARQHPVKWGVRVYSQNGINSFWVPVMGRNPEGTLVDASTWQVRRSDFDQMLLDTALARGVEFVEGTALQPLREGDAVHGVRVRTASGATEDVEAEVVIDASGMATFLCNAGVTSEKERGKYDKQVAIFAQVTGAIRDPDAGDGSTLNFYQQRNHWAWFIPLDADTTSVGVVVPSDYFVSKKESKHDFLVRELHELNPELARRLPEIRLTEEVRAISNYSYAIRNFTGQGYLCVGDAHRFVDPVFSFGLYVAIKEAEYATQAVAAYLNGAGRDEANPFAAYEQLANRGTDAFE
nr:FAD-dependent oxidoreductase [Gemmatimonadaceae bacterium]